MTKLVAIGVAVCAVAAWGWSASAQQTYTADSASMGGRGLISHFYDQQTGPQVLTQVDPQAHVIAVYHIDRVSGEIKLKSVRNFDLDLRLKEYNSGGLTPKQVREMLELQP